MTTTPLFTVLARDLIRQDEITYGDWANVAFKQLADLFNHARTQAQAALDELMLDEVSLGGDELEEKYLDTDNGHPLFTKEGWLQEAQQGDTLQGYWRWCELQIEQAVNDKSKR